MKKTKEQINVLSIIYDYILLNHAYFSIFSSNQRIKFFKKIKKFIDNYYKNSIVSNYILNHKILNKQLPAIRQLCLLYEKNLEKQYVNQTLLGNDSNLYRYIQPYQKFLNKEGLMAKMKDTSKIIILGSGYLPGTAILLNKIFKAKCTCLDNDIDAVKTSKKLINKLSLDKEISVEFGDATIYPLADYDVILVTGACFPKKDIFDHILKEVGNTKIIYRKPMGLYKMWYTPSSQDDINKFKIIKSIGYSGNYPFESVLLTKKVS